MDGFLASDPGGAQGGAPDSEMQAAALASPGDARGHQHQPVQPLAGNGDLQLAPGVTGFTTNFGQAALAGAADPAQPAAIAAAAGAPASSVAVGIPVGWMGHMMQSASYAGVPPLGWPSSNPYGTFMPPFPAFAAAHLATMAAGLTGGFLPGFMPQHPSLQPPRLEMGNSNDLMGLAAGITPGAPFQGFATHFDTGQLPPLPAATSPGLLPKAHSQPNLQALAAPTPEQASKQQVIAAARRRRISLPFPAEAAAETQGGGPSGLAHGRHQEKQRHRRHSLGVTPMSMSESDRESSSAGEAGSSQAVLPMSVSSQEGEMEHHESENGEDRVRDDFDAGMGDLAGVAGDPQHTHHLRPPRPQQQQQQHEGGRAQGATRVGARPSALRKALPPSALAPLAAGDAGTEEAAGTGAEGGGAGTPSAAAAAASPPGAGHRFRYIVQVGSGAWRAQVGHTEGGTVKKMYGPYRRTPDQAARDADKLLFRMRGPKQALNFGLSPEEREWVQSLSVQQLLGALQAGFTGRSEPIDVPAPALAHKHLPPAHPGLHAGSGTSTQPSSSNHSHLLHHHNQPQPPRPRRRTSTSNPGAVHHHHPAPTTQPLVNNDNSHQFPGIFRAGSMSTDVEGSAHDAASMLLLLSGLSPETVATGTGNSTGAATVQTASAAPLAGPLATVAGDNSDHGGGGAAALGVRGSLSARLASSLPSPAGLGPSSLGSPGFPGSMMTQSGLHLQGSLGRSGGVRRKRSSSDGSDKEAGGSGAGDHSLDPSHHQHQLQRTGTLVDVKPGGGSPGAAGKGDASMVDGGGAHLQGLQVHSWGQGGDFAWAPPVVVGSHESSAAGALHQATGLGNGVLHPGALAGVPGSTSVTPHSQGPGTTPAEGAAGGDKHGGTASAAASANMQDMALHVPAGNTQQQQSQQALHPWGSSVSHAGTENNGSGVARSGSPAEGGSGLASHTSGGSHTLATSDHLLAASSQQGQQQRHSNEVDRSAELGTGTGAATEGRHIAARQHCESAGSREVGSSALPEVPAPCEPPRVPVGPSAIMDNSPGLQQDSTQQQHQLQEQHQVAAAPAGANGLRQHVAKQEAVAAAGVLHQQQPNLRQFNLQQPGPGPAGKSYSYIVRIGNRYRAQVGHMQHGLQRKYYAPYQDTPEAAAHDADLLLYKLRGPQAPTNFTLSPETRTWLDGISLSDLVAWFRARPSSNGTAEVPTAAGAGAAAHAPAAGGSRRASRGTGTGFPADNKLVSGSAGGTAAGGVGGSTGALRPTPAVPSNTSTLPLAAALQALVAWQKHSAGQGAGSAAASNGTAGGPTAPGNNTSTVVVDTPVAGATNQHPVNHVGAGGEAKQGPPAPPPAIPMLHNPAAGSMLAPRTHPPGGGGAAAASGASAVGGPGAGGLTPAQLTAAAAALALLVKKQQQQQQGHQQH